VAAIAVILDTAASTDLDQPIADWTTAGHVVTKIDDVNLDTPGYGATLAATYDLVVWNGANTGTRATEMRSVVALGVPVLLSVDFNLEIAGQTVMGTSMGVTGLVDQRRANSSTVFHINIVDNTHAITTGFGTGQLAVRTGVAAARIGCVASGQSFAGTLLANGSSIGTQSGLATLIAMEVGTPYLSGGGSNSARIVYYGNLRNDPTEQTADQVTLQLAITNWLLASAPPSTPSTHLRLAVSPRFYPSRMRII
jgi:hypothetical protein